MLEQLRNLYRYRELLLVWSAREIKVRYSQSVLGGAWAILQPLSLMVVFSVIFSMLVKVPTDGVPYPVFSYVALLPWTFFVTSITFGVSSVTQNMNLVTKIYFPREILPLASIVAAFVDFLVASTILVAMMLFYRIPLGPALLIVPLLLAIQTFLALGFVLIASAVNVFYRDVRFVVPLALQLWMYATPIIYPASVVPQELRTLYFVNPMAGLVEAYRAVALHSMLPDWPTVVAPTCWALVIFAIGYGYFKRAEPRFADLI